MESLRQVLEAGQPVRLHPMTDQFMRGVTDAMITKIGRKWIHFRCDRTRTNWKVSHALAKNGCFLRANGDLILCPDTGGRFL